MRVVVEGGMGDRWDEKHQRIYRIQFVDSLRATLAALGLTPDDIDHVVLSHCHFDHIGALEECATEPGAPCSRGRGPRPDGRRWGRAPRAGARAASYRADDIQPLLDRGLVDMHYEGPARSSSTASRTQVRPRRGSDGVSVIGWRWGVGAPFWADVVPTTHHIQPPYIMAYDLNAAPELRGAA